MKHSAALANGGPALNQSGEDFRQKASDLAQGLPAPLPAGERLVWQGRPNFRHYAFQVFHIRLIAAYFAVLAAWGAFTTLQEGSGIQSALSTVAIALGVGTVVVGILSLLAWLGARSTIYSVTTGRIVMRIGIALNKTIDIPFKAIRSVDLKVGANGVGNISIDPDEKIKLPYLMLWPHVRPWRVNHPQPMLRAIPNAQAIAGSLVDCLEEKNCNTQMAEARSVNANRQTDVVPPPPPDERFLRIPLLGAAALVVFSLFTVGLVQYAGFGSSATARLPESTHQVSFQSLDTNRLAIVDAEQNETLAILEPGGEGLVRNALRGLERSRKLNNLPIDAPYQVVFWDDGRVTLSDDQTSRHIPLSSFAWSESKAMDVLMALNTDPTR